MRSIVSGDVVILKSGGPRMTFEPASDFMEKDTEWVRCIWFDNHGLIHEQEFLMTSLRLAEES